MKRSTRSQSQTVGRSAGAGRARSWRSACRSACAVAPASARAAAVFSVPGAAGAGPARYDRVPVERFGPASARTVLVLVPGKTSGAGVFAFVARDLVRRVRGLQVWAVDRREQAFEDTSVIAAGDPDQAVAYYLRGQPVGGRLFSPPPVSEVRFMAKWGLGLLVGDLHQVVRKARAGGRRVILGGHSLGASVAEAYASWDFAGRAGLSRSGRARADRRRTAAGAELTHAGAGAGDPGCHQDGGSATRRARPAPPLSLRGAVRDSRPVRRKAAAGTLATGHHHAVAAVPTAVPRHQPDLAGTRQPVLLSAPRRGLAHAGHPAASGDPRPWIDGDITPIARLARLLTRTPINSVDWYIPRRLVELDIRAAEPLATTPLTRLLGLRLTHRAEIRLPLYAFQTGSAPTVLRGARRLARASRIRRPSLAFDRAMTHFDPLTAIPNRNSFLRSITPFLKQLAH